MSLLRRWSEERKLGWCIDNMVDENTYWVCVKEVNRCPYDCIKHVTVKFVGWVYSHMEEQKNSNEWQHKRHSHQASVDHHVTLLHTCVRFGINQSSLHEREKKHVLSLRVGPKQSSNLVFHKFTSTNLEITGLTCSGFVMNLVCENCSNDSLSQTVWLNVA